jgi:hypothetical protein
MDFLNYREGGYGFSIRFSSFFLYRKRNCMRLREFEETEISSKAVDIVEVTVNNKEQNSYDFCLDFVQESASVILREWFFAGDVSYEYIVILSQVSFR